MIILNNLSFYLKNNNRSYNIYLKEKLKNTPFKYAQENWKQRGISYPVSCRVRGHQCLKVIPPVVRWWTPIYSLWNHIQKTNRYVPTSVAKPFQQEPPGSLHP